MVHDLRTTTGRTSTKETHEHPNPPGGLPCRPRHRPVDPRRLRRRQRRSPAATPAAAQPNLPPFNFEIRTLSNRADLISDGNALVEVSVPKTCR
jgi:hypothetical protein